MNMNNIRLLVDDFDACFKFYSETMEFPVCWGKIGDAYGSFDVSEHLCLSIFKRSLMNDFLKEETVNNGDNVLLVFQSENVDKTYKELQAKGISFINEPTDMTGWGIRVVHLKDPEGNLIELNTELDKLKWDEDLLKDAKEYTMKG